MKILFIDQIYLNMFVNLREEYNTTNDNYTLFGWIEFLRKNNIFVDIDENSKLPMKEQYVTIPDENVLETLIRWC